MSAPYRDRQKEEHERRKYKAEIASYGEKLQHVEAVGEESDGAGEGRVEHVPDNVFKDDFELCWARLSRQGKLNLFSSPKHQRSKNSPYGLSKTSGCVLREWA